jgi:hypothetical protein
VETDLARFNAEYKQMLADARMTEQEFGILVGYIRETEELNRELKRQNKPPITLSETDLEQRILATRPQSPRFPGTLDPKSYTIGLIPRTELAAEYIGRGLTEFIWYLLTHPDVAFSLFLDFLPVIGTIKGGIEAITGRDLITGDELPTWARALGAAAAAIPAARAGWKLAGLGVKVARRTAAVASKALAPIAIVVALGHTSPAEALRLLKHTAELDETAVKLAYKEAVAAGKGALPATKVQQKIAQDLSKLLPARDVAELERAAASKAAKPVPDVPAPPAKKIPEAPEGLPAGERRGGRAGRRPKGKGKKKFDLSKPGAFRNLAGTTPEEVADAIQDPALYDLYQASLGAGPRARKAAADIQDLAKAVAEHATMVGAKVTVKPAVSAAIWGLPENLRGVLIEKVLGETKYRGWIHAGTKDRGFFPQIDFITPSASAEQRVSIKSANPYTKGYEKTLNEVLPSHLEDIVTGTDRYVVAGRRPPSITLHVLMPQGSAIPREALVQTLRELVPKHLQKYVKIQVEEF